MKLNQALFAICSSARKGALEQNHADLYKVNHTVLSPDVDLPF